MQSFDQGTAVGQKDFKSNGLPLADKVAVVVGAGRGIGRATAKRLASAGARVIVVSRTPSELEEVAAEIQADGGRAISRVADITRFEDVQSLADFVRVAYGRVDVLVNSAGASLIAALDATTPTEWDRIMDTNLKGPYLCIWAMLDMLRASTSGQIVNIASKVGLTGHKLVSAYSAAKAGLIGFSRSLAHELRTDNVRVVVICPGPVDTPMRWAATPHLDPRMAISASTVADTILFLVTLDSAATAREIVLEAIEYDETAVPIEASQHPVSRSSPVFG
jgi:NAD(P)-dependent dehydrogenase (short-subunit alcohol dehydrogenase family)